jgi:glycosyltransferase involved in cell wall biosynthesis
LALFHPPESKPDGALRIGFMPRKNKALAEQIRRIFEERNPKAHVQWVPIHGLDRPGVAEALRSCHVFLVTGFPEGCPLPPLEAMACGCRCVGFTGFGGWDYMRQVELDGYAPYGYPLRDVPWGGNGWWSADGDVLGAALGLERAARALPQGSTLLVQTAQTAAAYGSDDQRREIVAALTEPGTVR